MSAMDLTPFHGAPATAPAVPGFAARTLLGFGAHGEVWLADDLSTGGEVALKIGLRAAKADGPAPSTSHPSSPGGPEEETAVLCRIDHPHIVRLQRVVPLPEGGLALVLDLASGGSLASLVAARGRFDPGEVSTLLVPLAGALDHLHRRGVVHGDIAPGNVLFAADGRPQLGDLGVARVLGARVAQVWATPGFVDPSLTGTDDGSIDPRAVDLWGLAAVGWFALTGRPPGTSPDLLTSDRSPQLAALLHRCLTADPADRPTLDELADGAWQAARPVPVRLVTRQPAADSDTGLPPLAGIATRPVRVAGSAGSGSSPITGPAAPAADPTWPTGEDRHDTSAARSWPARWAALKPGSRRGLTTARGRGGPSPAHRRLAVLTVAGAGAVLLAMGLAALARPSEPSASGATGRSATPGQADSRGLRDGSGSAGELVPSGREPAAASGLPTAGPVGPVDPVPSKELESELTDALTRIGRSRARAFAQASARHLDGADVAGSPAYLEDLELVQRLRARGYRLRGVRYEVSEVRVLHRRGALVEVRAMVTTSRHRQVPTGSSRTVEVPRDGPRPVVFTVAPIDLNLPGPARWRVRDVQVSS